MSIENYKRIPIDGYEGYEIDSFGLIYKLAHVKHSSHRGIKYSVNKEETIIRPYKEKKGYLRVSLLKNGKQIKELHHRLVANAFVPNSNNFPIVNHKDGVKWNNDPGNLEWVTLSENILHGYKTGLIVRGGDGRGSCSKLTEKDVCEIKQLIKHNMLHKDIAFMYDVSENNISKINCGRSWVNVS